MRISLAAIGFTSTVAQVVLMREMVAAFYGNELLLGLVLAAWLAWVAVGSWGLGRLAARFAPGYRAFAVGLVLSAIIFPLQIALARGTREILGVTPGAFVEFGPMVVTVALILAPLCLLMGLLFTMGARLAVKEGSTAGRAYVWEGVGAVAGGLVFSFVFVRRFDPFQVALLVGSANLLVAAWVTFLHMMLGYDRPAVVVIIIFVVATNLFAVSLPLGGALQNHTLQSRWPGFVFAADSEYGRIVVQAYESQRVFYENGLLTFETQGAFSEEVAHFPLLAHPGPKSVLLIGGGVAGDLREILKHPVDEVYYVELDPLLIEAAREYLPPKLAAPLDDPRVRLQLSDGRLYVKQTTRAFDVVILDLPEPSTGAINRFYTREFFEEVRGVLKPGGIFALGLPSAENYISPELARRNGSVYQTLRAVFPEVLVLPGEHNFFLASDVPVERDPGVLAARLGNRGVETRQVTPEYVEYVLTTDRFESARRELEEAAGARLNEDLRPICYYYSMVLWLSRFYPGLRDVFERDGLFGLWWLVVPVGAALGLVFLRRRWAVPIAMGGTGLAGMALEVVILLTFQVLHGCVYSALSLVVAAFMAGLVAGGEASNRLLAGWGNSPEKRARRVLAAVQVAIAVYGGLFPPIIMLRLPAPTLLFTLLALVAGALGGMAFPLALAALGAGDGDAGRAAGTLYGADLAGGCIGAVLSAVLLVPLLGIPQTCIVVALVGLAGALALAFR